MMQLQKQPSENKWLSMGVTPPHIFQESLNKEVAAKEAFRGSWRDVANSKRDYVAFCYWADKTFPDGFTFADLIDRKGKTALYWRQYIHELKNKQAGIVTAKPAKKTGNKQGMAAVYAINPDVINALKLKEESK